MGYIRDMRGHIGHDRLLIVGAGVFVYKDGKLLLQKRRDNGCWANHGGCLEVGETPEETARRELFEETGLTANALIPLGTFSGEDHFYTYPNGDQVYILDLTYLCEEFTGETRMQECEVSDLKWFPVNALPDNISPPIARSLRVCVETLRKRHPYVCEPCSDVKIEPLTPPYRARVDELIRREWYDSIIVSRGRAIDTRALPGFLALDGDEIIGCVTYRVEAGECEIVTLNSLREGQGIGCALLRAVWDAAKEDRCRRAWLITTNDNLPAIRFYQRHGFTLAKLHANALQEARKIKPSIPEMGMDGIPLLHELEFEHRILDTP